MSKTKINTDVFEQIYTEAQAAGMVAGIRARPTPVIFGTATSLTSDGIDYTKLVYHEPEGCCGFAWVVIKPGNSPFANWLKKNGYAKPAYQGGVQISISGYNQSMTRKEAHANAVAAVLTNYGIWAYADSRMD